MKINQLTSEQAIAIAESGLWKKWSNEDVVRFQLFQRCLCMDFGRFHEAIEAVLGRPVSTRGFTSNGGLQEEYLSKKKRPLLKKLLI